MALSGIKWHALYRSWRTVQADRKHSTTTATLTTPDESDQAAVPAAAAAKAPGISLPTRKNAAMVPVYSVFSHCLCSEPRHANADANHQVTATLLLMGSSDSVTVAGITGRVVAPVVNDAACAVSTASAAAAAVSVSLLELLTQQHKRCAVKLYALQYALKAHRRSEAFISAAHRQSVLRASALQTATDLPLRLPSAGSYQSAKNNGSRATTMRPLRGQGTAASIISVKVQ